MCFLKHLFCTAPVKNTAEGFLKVRADQLEVWGLNQRETGVFYKWEFPQRQTALKLRSVWRRMQLWTVCLQCDGDIRPPFCLDYTSTHTWEWHHKVMLSVWGGRAISRYLSVAVCDDTDRDWAEHRPALVYEQKTRRNGTAVVGGSKKWEEI